MLKENEELCRLNDRYSIIQDRSHFRFTTDSVILAGFCRASSGDRCADLGAGQGILSVLLFSRNSVGSVDAVEIQPGLCDMLRRTAKLNRLDSLHVHECDIRLMNGKLPLGVYDTVICNPPYQPDGSGEKSANSSVRTARHEIQCTLEDAICSGVSLLRFGGRMSLCLRPTRLCDVVMYARNSGAELKRLRFVQPYAGARPTLMLAELRRGGKPDVSVEPALVLYDAPGVESAEMKSLYAGGCV